MKTESHDPIPAALMQKIRVMSECDEVREIPDFPLYAITLTGQVWSVKPPNGRSPMRGIPKLMKVRCVHNAWTVNLHNESGIHSMTIARLMLISFVNNAPFEDAKASFIDGNFSNFALSNLEWTTHSWYRMRAVKRHGGNYIYGEDIGPAKLTEVQVRQIRRAYLNGVTITSLAKDYQMGWTAIYNVVNYKSWKHVTESG